MGSCRNALSEGKRPPSDILLRSKLFNPRRTRATRSKRHSGGCMLVSSSKPKILLHDIGRNRIPPSKPACKAGKRGGPRNRHRHQQNPNSRSAGFGSIGSRWESPKPASDLRSLWETPGACQSKVISLVDNIFRIRRKIEDDDFLRISCFADAISESHNTNILYHRLT